MTEDHVTDVETDGHDPLQSSMLSFASVACDAAGHALSEFEAARHPRADARGFANVFAKLFSLSGKLDYVEATESNYR